MLAKIGNMGRVYRTFAETQEITSAAERSMEATMRRATPLEAEIVPGCDPMWYVVLPLAGCAGIAARHLIRRRFGLYQPMIERVVYTRRGRVKRKETMFPGYLFTFIWDVDKHFHRVRNCPGVLGFLMDRERPVAMPDRFIMRMQVEEFISEGLGQATRRFRRRYRKQALNGHFEPVEFTISTKSYWRQAVDLEGPERIGLLHKALGLPSQDKNRSGGTLRDGG
jgi:transcription antitermination factor NusG